MKVSNWLQFTKERFEPVSHFTMLSVSFWAHLIVFDVFRDPAVSGEEIPLASKLFLMVATIIFYFKLRLYDEIKDYEVDLEFNPTRPLARGLLNHQDLYRGIAVCIALELIAFSLCGIPALVAGAIAIVYSLIMYKEFFIPEIIRPHLTTYAMMHTVVTVFFSMALLSSFQGQFPWELPPEALYFSIANWGLFNIFEFGRKTFASSEEREGVESYSKVWTRVGAVVLVLGMACISTAFYSQINFKASVNFQYALIGFNVLMGAIGLAYLVTDGEPQAKIYRGMSSGYIVLVMVGLIALEQFA